MNNLAVTTALATSPSTAFAELKERPRFWFPLLVVILSSAAMVIWYFSVVDIEWYKDTLFANNPDFQKMPEEQRAGTMAFMGAKTMMITGVIWLCIAIPGFYLLHSLYLLLAAKVTKVPLGFKHWLTLTSWTALPAVLGVVVGAIFLLIRDNDQVGPGILAPLGLNELFFHRPVGGSAQTYLDALNIPGFLGWILAIIGLQNWSQRSWLYSTIVIMIPVVLLYGIWGLFALR